MRVTPGLLNIPPTIFETLPRVWKNVSKSAAVLTTNPTVSPIQTRPIMSSSGPFADYGIENSSIKTAPGVSLSESQQLLTGSILDLFAGRPSLRKLSLWKDDAVFTDPITIAESRSQFAPQWYGLKVAFSDIQRLHYEVTSGGNPIEMNLKTKYTVKGIGSEQTISSKVKIYTTPDEKQITKVEDRWDDSLPDGAFKNAMRNLNSVIVPKLVSVPKSIEEEEAAQKK